MDMMTLSQKNYIILKYANINLIKYDEKAKSRDVKGDEVLLLQPTTK